jgi:hypothetical protein
MNIPFEGTLPDSVKNMWGSRMSSNGGLVLPMITFSYLKYLPVSLSYIAARSWKMAEDGIQRHHHIGSTIVVFKESFAACMDLRSLLSSHTQEV